MAGHSKWNNIKNRKGAVDAKRGKVFAQVAKLIRVAVKDGGSGDPKFNPGLRVALDKARAANMPKDKVQKAIDRGLGKTASGAQLSEVLYEGFGPGGVAVLVAAITDNQNRTGADIRFAFSRSHGSLGGPGSASYMFERSPDGSWTPTMHIDLDQDGQTKLLELVSKLRENDDVEDVYYAAQLQED